MRSLVTANYHHPTFVSFNIGTEQNRITRHYDNFLENSLIPQRVPIWLVARIETEMSPSFSPAFLQPLLFTSLSLKWNISIDESEQDQTNVDDRTNSIIAIEKDLKEIY